MGTKYTNHFSLTTTLTLKPPHKVQADRVGIIELVEDTNVEEEKKSRAAEFESRARNMRITEVKLIAQKVVI